MIHEAASHRAFGPARYLEGEENRWNSAIIAIVNRLSRSRDEAGRFAIDAIQYICQTEDTIDAQRDQGFVRRIASSFSGADKTLDASRSLVKSQKAAFRILEKLGEQNVFLMGTLITLGNYCNYIHTENSGIRGLLLDSLESLRKTFSGHEAQIADLTERISRAEKDIKKLTNDVRIVAWVQTALVEDYDQCISDVIRLLKMVKDFSEVKEGYWTSLDFKQFHRALIDCGFKKGSTIRIRDFIKGIVYAVEDSIDEIRSHLSLDLYEPEIVSMPLFHAIFETTEIMKNNDKYKILTTVIKKARQSGSALDEKECLLDIACDHLRSRGIELDVELNFYELSIELLEGKRLIERLSERKTGSRRTADNREGEVSQGQVHEKSPQKSWSQSGRLRYVRTNHKGYHEYENAGEGSTVIEIPSIAFSMGNDGPLDSSPIHVVHLSRYYIGKYQVTWEQYERFVRETGYHGQMNGTHCRKGYEKHPAVQVTWHDAAAYARWAGGSLPTEAQWENAARSTGQILSVYSWDYMPGEEYCNYSMKKNGVQVLDLEGGRGTVPTDAFPGGQSRYGCYHMAGNVWEWCRDWYKADYYKKSPDRDPEGPDHGDFKALRGGSWNSAFVLMSQRFFKKPHTIINEIGFRIVLPAFRDDDAHR